MDKKQAYVEQQEAKLKQWNAEIARLRAKADKAKADAKVDYAERLEALEAKKARASKKLDELKQSSADAFEAIKEGMEHAWKDLGSAVDDARSKFGS